MNILFYYRKTSFPWYSTHCPLYVSSPSILVPRVINAIKTSSSKVCITSCIKFNAPL